MKKKKGVQFQLDNNQEILENDDSKTKLVINVPPLTNSKPDIKFQMTQAYFMKGRRKHIRNVLVAYGNCNKIAKGQKIQYGWTQKNLENSRRLSV